jgi:hypothetical protein
LEEGEATGGGRECILLTTLTPTVSWRRRKQEVEVESGEREKQHVVEQSVFLY